MADACSAGLVAYWPLNNKCGATFASLFENELAEFEDMAHLESTLGDDSPLATTSGWRLETLPSDSLPRDFSPSFPSTTGRDIDFEFERVPLTLRSSIVSYVRRLVPRPAIAARVDEIAARLSASTVGVHLRTWQVLGTERGLSRECLFDRRMYHRILDKLETSDFFVAGDSHEEIEALRRRYRGRILTALPVAPGIPPHTEEAVSDALVDLLVLARTQSLVVPWLSTFSDTAWWLGGCTAQVTVVPPRTYLYRQIDCGTCLFWRWRLRGG